MKEFKGTKGKWMYAPHMGDYNIRVDDGTKYHRMITICEVNFNSQRPNEVEANAQLIAAAPELLAACIESLRYVCCEEPAFDTLNKAIAKALGKGTNDE